MLYLLYKIGLLVLRVTSTRCAYILVSFFATLQFTISKRDREIVKKNLRIVLPHAPESTISQTARRIFNNFGKYLVDFFSIAKNKSSYLKEVVNFDGLENVDEALRFGKGCIIMTGHFGNWELAGCALANTGYKMNVIALAHTDRRINNLFINQRKKSGINVIHIGNAKTHCLNALYRGEVIAILADRPYGDRGIEVSFFGEKALFPRGAALFSLKSDAPIIFGFTFKEDEDTNRYKVVFDKPFRIKREGTLAMQLQEITQRFAERFETYIRKHPAQWYMFNEIWEQTIDVRRRRFESRHTHTGV